MSDIFCDKSLNKFPRDSYGYSQFNQAEMLLEIYKIINTTNKYFV